MMVTEQHARTMPDGGLRLWVPLIGPIVAWTSHLVVDAGLSRLSCNDHSYMWVQHAWTAVTALFTLWCIAMCVRLARFAPDGEDAGTPAGRTKFLGVFGTLSGVINLALILVEGLYVVAIPACHGR